MAHKKLAEALLNHYINVENESTNDYHYFCHTECDSNVTKFESLSNANKIVLKSKINFKYIPIIMRIFHCVYDDNYWIFECEDFIDIVYTDSNIELDPSTLEKLKNYNLLSWIEIFEFYYFRNYNENKYSNFQNTTNNELVIEDITNSNNSDNGDNSDDSDDNNSDSDNGYNSDDSDNCSDDSDSNDSDSDSDDIDNEVFVDNDRIYTSIPSVESKYDKSKKQQKVYTIKDIIKLIKKK